VLQKVWKARADVNLARAHAERSAEAQQIVEERVHRERRAPRNLLREHHAAFPASSLLASGPTRDSAAIIGISGQQGRATLLPAHS
jgi:hypothetical protein